MNILIVDDEPEILKKVSILVEESGYSVKTLNSFEALAGMVQNRTFYPRVIVLDRMLNGKDSIDLIPKIKMTFQGVKILIVSAIDTAMEKAQALDRGADDYLAKPFSAVELVARLNALLRRERSFSESESIEISNIKLNSQDRTVFVNGAGDVGLSQKEFLLLYLLASNPGKIFPKEILLNQVWKSQSDVESKVVEATVNNVRRKLEGAQAQIRIKNIRNVGYWFEV